MKVLVYLVKAIAVGSDRLTQFYKLEPAEADVPMLFELGASYTIMQMPLTLVVLMRVITLSKIS